jgi:ferredoxin--NADP+ reductase
MNRIIEKQRLNECMVRMVLEAPQIATSSKPGQFIVLRIAEKGERFPLTLAGVSPDKGTITIIFQEIGKSTKWLSSLDVGSYIMDIAGPLGRPTHIEKFGTSVCVAGGVGVAEVYPISLALKNAGNNVISIIGFRTKNLIILEQEMKIVSNIIKVTTDDGSYGIQGTAPEVLKEIIDRERVDIVFAVGPIPMMRAVAETTRPYNIKTIVSLNSIMVDGTGMCGSCRISVGGKTMFTCVDGPDFDAHLVDFKELSTRQLRFIDKEKHSCKIFSIAAQG